MFANYRTPCPIDGAALGHVVPPVRLLFHLSSRTGRPARRSADRRSHRRSAGCSLRFRSLQGRTTISSRRDACRPSTCSSVTRSVPGSTIWPRRRAGGSRPRFMCRATTISMKDRATAIRPSNLAGLRLCARQGAGDGTRRSQGTRGADRARLSQPDRPGSPRIFATVRRT